MGSTAAKLQAVLNSKNAIKDSLENKGLSPSNKFSEYAGLIDELENTSDATATAATIFEGEVAYTAEGRTVGTATPGTPIVNTAGTGAAYTATVPNMAALTVGKTITIIPHTTSTSANATLNVNGLGAKYIRQRLSTNTGATAAGYSDGWILSGKPLTLMYNGTYWVSEITRPDANTIYGTTKIENGGTGASTADGARANLGALGKSDVVDNLESTATDLPASANSVRLVNEKVNELNSNLEQNKNLQWYIDNGFLPNPNDICNISVYDNRCQIVKNGCYVKNGICNIDLTIISNIDSNTNDLNTTQSHTLIVGLPQRRDSGMLTLSSDDGTFGLETSTIYTSKCAYGYMYQITGWYYIS